MRWQGRLLVLKDYEVIGVMLDLRGEKFFVRHG